MKILDPYILNLRQCFQALTVADGEDVKRVVMVGAWLHRSEGTVRLEKDDLGYLSAAFQMVTGEGLLISSEFDVDVVDLNDTGEDFLQNPVPADLVVLSYIVNTAPIDQVAYEAWFKQNFPNVDRSQMSEKIGFRNPNLQSDKNVDSRVWERACIASGAKAVATVFNQNLKEVCVKDFSSQNFRMAQIISHEIPQISAQIGKPFFKFCALMLRNE